MLVPIQSRILFIISVACLSCVTVTVESALGTNQNEGSCTMEGALRLESAGPDSSVAVITLLHGLESQETTAWGTKLCEHRINLQSVKAINTALDRVEGDASYRALILTGEGKFFSNGLDLKWIDTEGGDGGLLQQVAEELMARILTFPLPTVAAINGHFVAGGAMLGLAFDYRIMNRDKGYFFVPGIDIGLVYSKGMTELIKSKTPAHMHRDMMVYGQRYTSAELLEEKVVTLVAPQADLIKTSIDFLDKVVFQGKSERFKGPIYRKTMQKIKRNTYALAYQYLSSRTVENMGFDSGTWDKDGKSKL